jgi:hypothetical protein
MSHARYRAQCWHRAEKVEKITHSWAPILVYEQQRSYWISSGKGQRLVAAIGLTIIVTTLAGFNADNVGYQTPKNCIAISRWVPVLLSIDGIAISI